ncbi:hypothetical protein Bca4012_025609 [Brassica carinata]|uniref:Uncharacterized protein n=1 Tax=Brassica carinata TaxID=52824 RepID=A0A8X7VH22_BRACI|nr:hypothetical protein Bca52824_022713 [Brassica carinata]
MAFLFPEEELDSNPAPILSSASHTAVSQPSSLKFNMSPASPLDFLLILTVVNRLKSIVANGSDLDLDVLARERLDELEVLNLDKCSGSQLMDTEHHQTL